MVIFNKTSADFVLMSADVVLKMTTILKEISFAQLCSKSERTLVAPVSFLFNHELVSVVLGVAYLLGISKFYREHKSPVP